MHDITSAIWLTAGRIGFALGYAGTSLHAAGAFRRRGKQKLNGAQGRDRTTDTAIFSRMLYQLSYLGILGRPKGLGERAVYREVGGLCPPGFAFGYAGRSPASTLSPNSWQNLPIRRLRGPSRGRG